VENPVFKFAVIGDIGVDNQWCMVGVSRITPMVKKLGASSVLIGDSNEWRVVNVQDDASFDLAKAVKKAFADKRPPLDLVENGGVPFVLCNTREMFDEDWTPFSRENDERLERSNVFFYAQYYHPMGTGIGYFMPRQDRGCVTKVFKGRKNCVVFSSGALGPLADERAIKQGDFGFTAAVTSSFRYTSLLPGRANFEMKSPLNRPGLLVSVFADRLVFKRVLFTSGETLGDDWVMPFADYGALSYERRAEQSMAPEFPDNAKVKVTLEQKDAPGGRKKDFVRLDFPKAKGKVRPFEYEITVHSFEGDIDAVVAQKRMYSPGIFGPCSEEPRTVTCRIEKNMLIYHVPVMYEVMALDSFGT
jgi:hypothetical protein